MKKITFLAVALLSLNAYSQEHFSAISTTQRVGILNGNVNPSEFANLNSKYEIQLMTFSVNVSNNKLGFKDLSGDEDVETLLFDGKGNVDFSFDAAIFGPSFGMRYNKWGFGVSSKAFIKASVINLNTNLGNALINENLNSAETFTSVLSKDNQRISATTWGEIGISVARNVFETEKHRINAGVTLKLLFPGSYANVGLNNFDGDIVDGVDGLRLTNTQSSLNIAYSGNFSSSFGESDDYVKSVFGGLNGFATDFGVDYQLLNEDKTYRLKVGASVRNIGSMTFAGADNVSNNYSLNIPNGDPGLNLDEFENVEGLEDIEAVLLQHPEYFTSKNSTDEFKVKLPTVFNIYADYNIVKRVAVTAFLQQKMGDENNDDQISTQNMFTVTPRVTFGAFEAMLPIGNNEIAGGTLGFGLRIGGFFLGSNSIISAVASDSKQADVYFGFRFGFRQNE
ncbi:hypothetical protein [Flavobacterium sp. SM2513]|uniref:hypothetical protein n=1 Tax=Flavobacterium sp. SM2513 TaxID=3424766 RepID=UPI003D7F25CF